MMDFMGSDAILTLLMLGAVVSAGMVLYKGFKIMVNEVK